MRVAVIGAGRVGAFHAETLTTTPTVDEVIVVNTVYAGALRATEYSEIGLHKNVDTVGVVMHLTCGALGMVEALRDSASGHRVEMEVAGSRGCGRTADGDNPNVADSGGCVGPGFLARFGDAYRNEMAVFVSLVHGEIGSPSSADDASETLRIALAATRSWREGRAVRLADYG